MTSGDADPRSEQRFPVALRVRLKLSSGEIESKTDTISRGGFGLLLPSPPPVGDAVDAVLYLRDGAALEATATCRDVAGERAGFSLALKEKDDERWRAFLATEQDAGNLWHLMGRFASTSGAEKEEVRSILERHTSIGLLFKRIGTGGEASRASAMRFHRVGENGEAYRVAFEKHGGVPPEKSDLVSIPGFKGLAVKVASRVLKQDVTIRRDANSAPTHVRVVEIEKGGFAMVHGGMNGVPVGVVSLAVGELILIEVDGQAVFPFFGAEDLERIACDTYRKEERPRVVAASFPEPEPLLLTDVLEFEAPAEISFATPQLEADLAAVAAAQDATPRATRRYGERVIELFPHAWVRATFADGDVVTGPTMRDGTRLLVLVVDGARAPRVARLERAAAVSVVRNEA